MTPEERYVEKYGETIVIATDQFRGRLHLCACGARVWSCWANAEKHVAACPRSREVPVWT